MIALVDAFVLGSLIVLLLICLTMFYQTLRTLKQLEARFEKLEQEISEIQTKVDNLEKATFLVCELQKILVEAKQNEQRSKHEAFRYFVSG